MRRIWRASVWAPGGVRSEDWRFRGLFRVVLPLMDVLLVTFGLIGWWFGLRSVDQSVGQAWQSWWSLGIALAAGIALVGVSFPRLWWLELAGKIPLIALLTFYIATLFVKGLDDPRSAAASGLVLILLLLPGWRVVDLGFVRWARKRGRL